MTEELKQEFIGGGEVRGFQFRKMLSNSKAYIYEIVNEGAKYYEVFERKTSPVCIDFEKRIYSETDDKVIYPKANSFGVWAWTFTSMGAAIKCYNSINQKKKDEQENPAEELEI